MSSRVFVGPFPQNESYARVFSLNTAPALLLAFKASSTVSSKFLNDGEDFGTEMWTRDFKDKVLHGTRQEDQRSQNIW